mmetsp:Transcript_17765/g.57471  ORF Transcript_17765/g.57471 Transcript_17765/m.57471 type:complete len:774 (+) Transcript_17765:76-2397(+)
MLPRTIARTMSAYASTIHARTLAGAASASKASRPARGGVAKLAVPTNIRHGYETPFASGSFATAGLRASNRASKAGPGFHPIRAMATDTDTQEETFEYQAEVNRLMDLIVNSLYSNKEVFLRELVSNASDALDKIRFNAVGNPDALAANPDLDVKISVDKEANTITIEDSGVGMTREDVLDSLGTIARSGTAKFMEMLKESKQDADNNLIGRFGVGFYSAFLVADKVRVQTKNNDDPKQWVWESSSGSHQFTIKEDAGGEPIARGTRITLYLKEDSLDLASPDKMAELVKQYSEFISFPIRIYQSKMEPQEVVDDEATAKAKEEWEAKKAAVEAKGEEWSEEEPSTVMKTDYQEEWAWRVQNSMKPIWVRSKSEVSKEDYNEFFKGTFKEFLDPLAYNHFNVEGTIEFKGILYCPGMAPFEQDQMMGKSRNMKLYVKRVFISDEFDEDLVPRYLTFIKGVVDSSDLPLNVSREILQESRVVRTIRKQIVRKSLDMVKEIAGREDKADYKMFWEAFGRNIKLGCIEDEGNREELSKLLRFHSSKTGDEMTSLADYVEGMKEGQSSIFYIAADSLEQARAAPFLEKLAAKDYEVLFLTEPIDEVSVTNIGTFDGKALVDITKEDVDLGGTEEDKAKEEELREEFKGLTEWMAGKLGDRVEKVTVAAAGGSTPALLVTSKFGWSANMERIMKAQAMGDNRAMEYMKGRKILEINPESKVIQDIKRRSEAAEDDPKAVEMAELLYDTALLNSGFQMEEPSKFAARIYSMMERVEESA